MDRGFSLIEVLVATTVTTIGTLALAQLCVMSMRMNQDARATTFATVLASQKMEQLRALAWASDALGVPSPISPPIRPSYPTHRQAAPA